MLIANSDPRRRGSALLAAMAMTITIAMLSAILLSQSVGQLRSQSGSIDKKRALYLAEAGLAEGLYSLRSGASGNVGDEDRPAKFGDGAFWVESVEDANGLFLIESTGISGRARATLRTVAEPTLTPMAALGVVGLDEVTIGVGATIEVDATGQGGSGQGGSDAGGAASEHLVVGSNGRIEVHGRPSEPTRVSGDLVPGPDSEVELGIGVEVSGSTVPRRTALVPPSIEAPAIDVEPPLEVPDAHAVALEGGQHHPTSLRIGEHGGLRLLGPMTLATESLVVERGARLEIDSSAGPVDIYVERAVHFGADAELVNLDRRPVGLRLFVLAGDQVDLDGDGNPEGAVRLPASGELHMQLIAPRADVEIPAHSTLHGSVLAGRLSVGEGATVRFDVDLLTEADDATRLSVISWEMLEIPESVRTRLGVDIVAELEARNGGALPRPADAERPAEVEITFVDEQGAEHTSFVTDEDFDRKQRRKGRSWQARERLEYESEGRGRGRGRGLGRRWKDSEQ